MPRSLTILLLLFAACTAGAATDADLAGRWEGSIELPGTKLALDIDLACNDGVWSGDITIPAQGATDLPLVDFEMSAAAAVFSIRDVPGDPTFHGRVEADGAVISGQFIQGGQQFPFRLDRGDDPTGAASRGLDSIGDTIAGLLAEWHTPGLALGVVLNGKVLVAEGYGLRDVDAELPVTSGTLFAIGSSTKAFTTFALGQLVAEDRLDWDRPVRDYLPEFKLFDSYASEHATPRDLVTHRTGLPRHDLVWYGNEPMERADLVSRLPYLEPNRELREQWQYNNLMFATAGYLAGRLRDATWEDVVRGGIFEPLGMTRSNFSVVDSQADADHARPYQGSGEDVHEVPFRNIDAMGPAGSINSCADDMVRWLLENLGESGSAGPLLAPELRKELQTPQMVIPGLPTESHLTPKSYAMGWFTDTWRGRYRVEHGGNIDGFTSAVWLFPGDGLGIVALSNRTADALPDLVAAVVADQLLGLEPMDHVGLARNLRVAGKSAREQASENRDRFRVEKTRPSHALGAYAGRFAHPGYGELEITVDRDALTLLFNGMSLPLEHWHYDVFAVSDKGSEPHLKGLKLNFLGDDAGRLRRLEIVLELLVDPIAFVRVPENVLSDPGYLARLVGRYELPSQVVTVAASAGKLTVTLPGQPTYTLVPAGDDEFTLKELKGFSLKFTLPRKGPATEAVFIQPNGVFAAQRRAED